MNRQKLQLTYTFHCNPLDLFYALYQPETLKNWFAEEVEYNEPTKTYTFRWSGASEKARLLEKDDEILSVRLEWLNEEALKNKEYLYFQVGELEDDSTVLLNIIDFCDDNEVENQRKYWEEQLHHLDMMLT
ncbi:MAG: hypothetical protein KDD63_27670 [Bacteroidetes bacterium]|nr:hypothetical protein [Bacteroidota bacterium]MCB0844838.1 hypothetical protein [Bacteroidota bacterium]MCB0856045.1 hypothetical protein [Bacteroidota bacterium]